MALVADRWEATYTLRGSSKKTATLTYQLRAADYATASTASTALIPLINAMTAAVITRYTVRQVFVEDALTVPAAVDLTDVAILYGGIDGELDKSATVKIPGFDRTAQTAMLIATTGVNANKIDITDTDVAAYWDAFASTGYAYISDGEDAEPTSNNGLYGGKLTSRASSEP